MRFFLIALATLTIAAPARADVFVPADPPSAAGQVATCRAVAGSVEVSSRTTPNGWRTLMRSGGGAWTPVKGIGGCPALTVGADGTVALTIESAIVVRSRGGAFHGPVAANRPLVAVAPDGRVTALAYEGDDVVSKAALRALAIAPDGSVTRGPVLGRGAISDAALMMDASGNATAAWTDATALRTARMSRTGAWAAGGSFVGEWVGRHFSLAVSPAGRTVLAWVAEGMVKASFDGGPAELAASVATAGSPRALIDDAGAAVVAFGAEPSTILLVERPADGAWSAPRAIQGSFASAEENEFDEDAREIELRAVLAPDGRVVLAWPTWARWPGGGLAAVSGRIGGPWAAVVPLSSRVRGYADWGLGLTPEGAPRVDWSERDGDLRLLPRAAVLVAAEPVDVPPPELTATLPERAPATRGDRLRVRVPVRCSAACDARVDIGLSSVVRSLAAGRSAQLGVTLTGLSAHPGNRRFRVHLTVADRAGNVVRRSSTLRVRVLRRPLRSFKVAPDHDFASCTRGGNRRLGQLVNSIIEGLADGSLKSAGAIRRAWRRGFDAIERDFPDECLGDTDVRDHIYEVLDTPLTLAGYPEFYLDE